MSEKGEHYAMLRSEVRVHQELILLSHELGLVADEVNLIMSRLKGYVERLKREFGNDGNSWD